MATYRSEMEKGQIKSGRKLDGRCPTFTERDERDIWLSLAWIGGVAERQKWYIDARDEMDESQEGWTVKDLYRGLVPNRLINSWKQFFGTTTFIVTYMATMFVNEIEESSRTGI
ncbi:hypothetical protein BGZ49_004983 [Haplosporangium sp. Z 27]|nr:hypothetical protein BGZ49_004983 [Haplosporangium sp. Z 27]